MRLHSVSLYNADADVLWLSEGALGPDEHNVVVEAIEGQKADKTQQYFEFGMEDGRMAVFLPIRGPRGDLAGTVMILADMKSLTEGTMERIVTQQIRTILVKIAMFMRKNAPASANDTSPDVPMPDAATPASVEHSTTIVIEKRTAAAALSPQLAPREVEQILELELVAEPAPAAVTPSPGPTPTNRKGAPAAVAPAAPKAALRAGTAPPGIPAAAPTHANSRSAPTLTPVPSKPVADIEVLAFDPDIQFPTAKPAAAPPADIEVLAFDIEPPVVVAAPAAPSPTPPPIAKATPVASAAPTSVPAVKAAGATAQANSGATSSVRAFKPTPGFLPELPPPAARKPAPGIASAPATTPPPVAAVPVVAPPVAAPPIVAPPAAKAAPVTSSTTQTTMLPVVSNADEVSGLINDTGPVPKLDMSSTIEPAPVLPPLEPLSLEESATDLTLFAQELIKLRSSGRTRRYEVLARSQRDSNRNEVPAAFLADSARGKDGAALDTMVLERLLTWLGKHGEAIWDSEPASFSVNLSIGAIEDETFPQQVEQWLEKNSVPAEYIGFEITEFACVQCKPAVQRFIDAIEKMGCFWVIDNFSLDSTVFELLGSKALRHVKLDPKLTAAAMKDKLPQALVVAILQACKVLGVHCVAKRIESQSAMQWLTAVGCDFAQSFSLHTPLPLESLASGQPIKALRE